MNLFKIAAPAVLFASTAFSTASAQQQIVVPADQQKQQIIVHPSNNPQPKELVVTAEDIKKYSKMTPAQASNVTAETQQTTAAASTVLNQTGNYALAGTARAAGALGGLLHKQQPAKTKLDANNFLIHALAENAKAGPLMLMVTTPEQATFLTNQIPGRKQVNPVYVDPTSPDDNVQAVIAAIHSNPTLGAVNNVFLFNQGDTTRPAAVFKYDDLKANQETLPNTLPLPAATTTTAPAPGRTKGTAPH